MIPRGKYLGVRVGDPPKHEAEHFIRCPACDGWIDCRDLAQALEHHGPLPHPAQDNRNDRRSVRNLSTGWFWD
jgi:hypothetical protein